MRFLYEFGISAYAAILRLVALWHPKARQMVEGRRDWREKLRSAMGCRKGRVVWFHCASLGEFEQGRPIMEAFMHQHPDWQLVLTFFSPSGYNVRKDYELADLVLYLPLDTASNARDFVGILTPDCAFFVKYEIWRNMLKVLHQRSIPTFLVSAIFRPSQLFFKPYGGWYRRLLRRFTHIYVQDDDSRQLLEGIGMQQVTVAGDSRFDRVAAAASSVRELAPVARFAEGHRVLIAGSTWPPDEEHLLSLAGQLPEGWKIILAPHEIEDGRIDRWIGRVGLPALRYTRLTAESPLEQSRVLIVDTIGILLSVYQYGDLAYIGGGFGAGIHNTLEPAAFGMPVIFGPNNQRFREAQELMEEGAAYSIDNADGLLSLALPLMRQPEALRVAGDKARGYVQDNTGASQLVLFGVNRIIQA
ncbi:MAG: 3-deoxy-D-manno-octulosonic acid transferase [Bacteroidetes bacterium]|nr:MAG: 3-deoxy-D-manno-octulosonic acid transferase [Bacteroidota bacterium]